MTDDQFPNDPTEPIPPVGGPTEPTMAQPVVPPPGPGEPEGGDGRPAWLVPAGAGLAIGLVIALIAVLVVRGGDDDEAATSTTVETLVTVPETTMRSACRGPGAKGMTPRRMKSCRAIDAAMKHAGLD